MILVIEDDAAARQYLSDLLAFAGYEVRDAANGLEALELLAASPSPPEFILLDLLMPEMHGWGLLSKLESDERFSAIPVVIISGIEDQLPPVYANIVGRLNKPVSAKELLQLVERHVPKAAADAEPECTFETGANPSQDQT